MQKNQKKNMKNYKLKNINLKQNIQIIKKDAPYSNYKNMKNSFKYIEVKLKKKKEDILE